MIVILGLLVLLTTLSLQTTGPATLYVAPTGDDLNPCTEALPCRQLKPAVKLAGPGTTILVADGEYRGFDILKKHGAQGSPITIKAKGTGAFIFKDIADRTRDGKDNIFVTFSSRIVIDGLRSKGKRTVPGGTARAGVRVDWSQNVAVKNCVFDGLGTWGIFSDFSDDLLVENNEALNQISQHGIYLSNSGDRPIVRGNRVYNNNISGIQLNGDLTSGGDGIISGALIENNVLWNNGRTGGAALNLDGVHDSVIRNNLLYGNRAGGIALFKGDGAEGPKGNKVYHNTVHQGPRARWALQVKRSAGVNVVRNNVLLHPHTRFGGISYFGPEDVTNTDSDYNIVERITPDDEVTVVPLATWKTQGHEPNSISAKSQAVFVRPMDETSTSVCGSADCGDYHLAKDSPALGKALALADVRRDIDGKVRPGGGGPDIGAYEAGAANLPLVLRVIPGEQTGLKASIEAWHAAAIASGSTGWWIWGVAGRTGFPSPTPRRAVSGPPPTRAMPP